MGNISDRCSKEGTAEGGGHRVLAGAHRNSQKLTEEVRTMVQRGSEPPDHQGQVSRQRDKW